MLCVPDWEENEAQGRQTKQMDRQMNGKMDMPKILLGSSFDPLVFIQICAAV